MKKSKEIQAARRQNSPERRSKTPTQPETTSGSGLGVYTGNFPTICQNDKSKQMPTPKKPHDGLIATITLRMTSPIHTNKTFQTSGNRMVSAFLPLASSADTDHSARVVRVRTYASHIAGLGRISTVITIGHDVCTSMHSVG